MFRCFLSWTCPYKITLPAVEFEALNFTANQSEQIETKTEDELLKLFL